MQLDSPLWGIHHGPQKRIGFKPVWQPDDHTSFFTASEGWGVYTQTITGKTQRHAIEIAWGELNVRTIVFELAEGVPPERVRVTLADQPVKTTFTTNDRELILTLGDGVQVAAPQTLPAVISSAHEILERRATCRNALTGIICGWCCWDAVLPLSIELSATPI